MNARASDKYILKGKEPVLEPDLLRWAKSFESENRIVGKDEIGEIVVSTVFLGLDHRFFGDSKPLLFETMIFKKGQSLDLCERYSTWDEAEIGHKKIVEQMKQIGGEQP